MKLENRLGGMSDDALLERLGELVRRQNVLTAALLAHIAEVDRRGLYLGEACSSMHRYCVERLGLSDGAAYKRIHAARAARRFPVLFEMIERGELHLKGITLLAPHLTEANYVELLARAKGQPVRAIEKLVAELAPRPAVPPRVRALPMTKAKDTAPEPPAVPCQGASLASRAPWEAADAQPAVARHSPAKQAARRGVAPLAPRRYELRVTIDEETHADLEQLQNLLGHQIPDGDPAEIVRRALALLVDRTLARKAAVTATTRTRGGNAGDSNERSRHIPAEVRRTVWLRDEGRCAFRDEVGNRCTAKSRLEFHHVDNWHVAPTTTRSDSNFAVGPIICTRRGSTTVRPSYGPAKTAGRARVKEAQATGAAARHGLRCAPPRQRSPGNARCASPRPCVPAPAPPRPGPAIGETRRGPSNLALGHAEIGSLARERGGSRGGVGRWQGRGESITVPGHGVPGK